MPDELVTEQDRANETMNIFALKHILNELGFLKEPKLNDGANTDRPGNNASRNRSASRDQSPFKSVAENVSMKYQQENL